MATLALLGGHTATGESSPITHGPPPPPSIPTPGPTSGPAGPSADPTKTPPSGPPAAETPPSGPPPETPADRAEQEAALALLNNVLSHYKAAFFGFAPLPPPAPTAAGAPIAAPAVPVNPGCRNISIIHPGLNAGLPPPGCTVKFAYRITVRGLEAAAACAEAGKGAAPPTSGKYSHPRILDFGPDMGCGSMSASAVHSTDLFFWFLFTLVLYFSKLIVIIIYH